MERVMMIVESDISDEYKAGNDWLLYIWDKERG